MFFSVTNGFKENQNNRVNNPFIFRFPNSSSIRVRLIAIAGTQINDFRSISILGKTCRVT